MKRHVLQINKYTLIGGTERVVQCLAHGLTERGVEVLTVFPPDPCSKEVLDWFCSAGVRAETDPAVLPMDAVHTWKGMAALRHAIRRSGAPAVNLHYGGNFLSLKDVLAVRLAGRRCVASIHHLKPWDEGEPRKREMTRIASRLCHAVVIPTEAMRAHLREAEVPDHKMHLIPYGLPVPSHLTDPEETQAKVRARARARLGLPHNAFVITLLARLDAYKGVDQLIEALASLPDPDDQLRLVVAGDGPQRPWLEALAMRRLSCRAQFLGRVAETTDVYAAADLFVMPSREEGFGLVYIEAAFHGVPSIGCRVGGVPVAIEEGATGLLIEPGDTGALSAAIQQLRCDAELRLRMGSAARERALREFTEATMAQRYEQVLLG